MGRLFDSPVTIIILLVVILLLFGAPKLPMIAKNVGKSLKIFKSEVKDLQNDDESRSAPKEITDAPATGTQAADPHTDSAQQQSAQPQSAEGSDRRQN
ncbi:Sec-independent protein translocase subunit TatA [Brevibacterium samyangense]|uniref:Sec-independent protein translocase protein TatA n=1 Tax=Brevibacterium samyangense TaxID=366888 RepID=A0ABN2TMV5_9MICO